MRPAGTLHSRRDVRWTKHSILDQPLRSCSIWMVRRDLLIASSRDMVSCPAFWSEQSPFGLQSLDPLSMSKVTAPNQQLAFDSWFLKEALTCPTKKVGFILLFPEDLGGRLDSGPSSIWALHEFKSLEGLQGGLRGVAYLCQSRDSGHVRPVGIFSNLANVCKSVHQGWPNLVSTVIDHIPTLSYTGPLQKTCP